MEQNDRWTPAKKALVEYKCVVCGHFQSFTKDSNDMHCAKCGGKIFVKPRRTSVKELDAI